MNKPNNFFFSLPDVLISKIYGYDNTYHNKFNTNEFRNQIKDMYMNINSKNYKKIVIDVLLSYNDDECLWKNEFGYIGNNESCNPKNTYIEYHNENDFDVYIHPSKNGILYFKVLPKGKINIWYKKSCLRKYYRFDGYFCHKTEQHLSDLDLYNTSPSFRNIDEIYEYNPYLYSNICMWY
jgi:hypothetical protein